MGEIDDLISFIRLIMLIDVELLICVIFTTIVILAIVSDVLFFSLSLMRRLSSQLLLVFSSLRNIWVKFR